MLTLEQFQALTNYDALFSANHSRTIPRFSVTNPAISYFSPKNEKVMFIESYAELNFALLLEADPAVLRFQSQPLSIEYKQGRRYTPDFVIETPAGLNFEEVKAARQRFNPGQKFTLIGEFFDNCDMGFSVKFVEHDHAVVRRQRRLYRYHAHDSQNVYERYPGYKGDIRSIISEQKNPQLFLCQLYAGVFKGEIQVLSGTEFSLNSTVQW